MVDSHLELVKKESFLNYICVTSIFHIDNVEKHQNILSRSLFLSFSLHIKKNSSVLP